MGILEKVLGSFLGSKSDRDLKETQPYVDKVLAVYPSIKELSNDGLRERSSALKSQVRSYVSDLEGEMQELKLKAEDYSLEIGDKGKNLRSPG